LPGTTAAIAVQPDEPLGTPLTPAVWRRVSWNYPAGPATRQRAKTSVTDLRRHQQQEEASPAAFVRRGFFDFPDRAPCKLSAAEAGLAHHRFLERVSLSEVNDAGALRREANRLEQEGWLTTAEREAVDIDSISAFWRTDLGRDISAHPESVRRELEFTARFHASDLGLELCDAAQSQADGDFIVVQGVADLAVLLPREIWLVDFKTDAVTATGVEEKAAAYETQLRLYAIALSRIYHRPVTRIALFFLKPQIIRPLEPASCPAPPAPPADRQMRFPEM
jgi:ATP-dependent helicase/nuclease subunit A